MRNQRDWVIPSKIRLNDENQEVEYLDLSAHRRKDGTSLRWPRGAEVEYTRARLKLIQWHHVKPYGKPKAISLTTHHRSDQIETYLAKRMRLDLREFMLHIVWVHGSNLISSWRPKHFDDLHQLVNARFSRKQGLAQHQLRHNASGRPYIYSPLALPWSSSSIAAEENIPIFVV